LRTAAAGKLSGQLREPLASAQHCGEAQADESDLRKGIFRGVIDGLRGLAACVGVRIAATIHWEAAIYQGQSGDLAWMVFRETAHYQATEGMADQNIWTRNGCLAESASKFLREKRRKRSRVRWLAPSQTCSIVTDDTSELGDAGLHQAPTHGGRSDPASSTTVCGPWPVS